MYGWYAPPNVDKYVDNSVPLYMKLVAVVNDAIDVIVLIIIVYIYSLM